MFDIDAEKIGIFLKDKLNSFEYKSEIFEYGIVTSCSDGIVQIDGLSACRYSELLEFENNAYGMVLDLRLSGVGAVLFSGADSVSAGSVVRGTGRVADICVGENLFGRIIDPLGRPLDGRLLQAEKYRNIESPAPGIMQRGPVNTPLETGLVSVDSMIPIGRGQRELIIGDRQTGKTTIATSAMLNQKGTDVICIYCSIGQKASTVSQLSKMLTEKGAMDKTIILASTASDSPAMQYIAPYAACAIAEEFMYSGKDVLIVYDDLSKHAVAYRAMSLLLRRPPGREAYPGDVFYLHSRLLERAAKLSSENGGGSMTALPIVETMNGDISAYIPTNVISITDGQIYLESRLFHSGVRPAINVGLSVSRVGRSAQKPAMRKVSKNMRLEIAQYRELAIFSQFGSDVDDLTKATLDKGERLTEIMKQTPDEIYTISKQTALLLAYTNDAFKGVELKNVLKFRDSLFEYLMDNHSLIMQHIDQSGELTDDDEKALVEAIKSYTDDSPITEAKICPTSTK